MGSTFKPSYSGVGQMLNSAFMEAAMLARAEKVRAAAEATAPVGGESDPHAGRYKASFHTTSGTHGGEKHDRAYGRCYNDSPEAVYVEFGTKYVPKHRTLGKALDAAGD